MIIYKITNLVNNKIYIGLTTSSLHLRWKRHVNESHMLKNTKPLYKAIRKYGEENFSIEQIDSADTMEKLGELERYYIKLYNSQDLNIGYNLSAGGERNQYDANPAAKLKVEDIINIRTIYKECKLSKKQCWLKYYQDKISFRAFEKIWCGITWVNIMSDVYTKENIEAHKKHVAHYGDNNYNAAYTNNEVLQMRLYYVNHTLNETFKKFSKNNNIESFRGALTETYSILPIYKKVKNIWVLNNKPIDINEYLLNNPVSTISVSGE